MALDIGNLSSLQLDVLKEIGSIGSGNAVTSLAKMISKRIDMTVPSVKILPFKEVSTVLGGEEILVIGIFFEMSGDIEGSILFILKYEDAQELVEMILKEPVNKSGFSSLELSVLKEVGNILVGSYVSAIAAMAGMRILPSVPAISIDMAGAILSVPAIQFGKEGDSVLYIETEFGTEKNKVLGDFFLVPEVGTFEKLLIAMGVIS